LSRGGLLLIEIAACNAHRCLELARSLELLANERIAKDSDGLDRVLIATRA